MPEKIKVIHFQRRPRPGFNFSIESIFENIRSELRDKISFSVNVCGYFNNGYFTKFWNIIEAALRQEKNSIAHITGEVHFINLLMRKKNIVLTIHDCRFMQRKTGFEKKLMCWMYLKGPVKRSAHITTVSEATKQEVIYYTGCDSEKITVIPVNVNPVFKPVPKDFNKECPVVLQIGAAENKILSHLINAIENIRCRLVIIGEPKKHDLDKLISCNIEFTVKHNLSTEDLYREYVNSDIVSFVSTFEGFGMPIIEANSVERAVITSNISSMPEVAGDAASLVNPYDVKDIREGLLKIIENDVYRDQLIINGRENKKRFAGETIADAYYEIYKKMTHKIR